MNNMEEKSLITEVKLVSNEFTAKEWAAVVAGVLTFVILTGLCG